MSKSIIPPPPLAPMRGQNQTAQPKNSLPRVIPPPPLAPMAGQSQAGQPKSFSSRVIPPPLHSWNGIANPTSQLGTLQRMKRKTTDDDLMSYRPNKPLGRKTGPVGKNYVDKPRDETKTDSSAYDNILPTAGSRKTKRLKLTKDATDIDLKAMTSPEIIEKLKSATYSIGEKYKDRKSIMSYGTFESSIATGRFSMEKPFHQDGDWHCTIRVGGFKHHVYVSPNSLGSKAWTILGITGWKD